MILLVIALLLPMTAMAEKPNNSKKADKEYQELLKKSPFNKMYPQDLANKDYRGFMDIPPGE